MLPAARGVYPEEAAQHRIDAIRSFQSAATQIDVDYMPDVSGFNPFGGEGDPVGLARGHLLSMERAKQAQREGYDAFIPFGMLDVGVDLARHVVDIPVIGQAQSTYALARTMADRCCAIFYNSRSMRTASVYLKRYGAEDLVTHRDAVEMSNADMHTRRDELRERFVSKAKRAVADGAQLIIANGMSMCPVEFSAAELAADIGVPVLEGMGSAVAMAETWHRLGVATSRARYPLSKHSDARS
jgi:allantoin racemase